MKPQKGRSRITPMTQKTVDQVKAWAKPDFDQNVLSHPLGLCSQCRVRVSECAAKKAPPTRPGIKAKWAEFKLQNIFIPARGQQAQTCICDMCTALRGNHSLPCHVQKVVPKGEPAQVEAQVQKSPKGPCAECLQENTGPGIPHPCTSSARKENLVKLALKEGTGAEQVAAAVMKSLAKPDLDTEPRHLQLKQLRGGNSLRVKLGEGKKTKPKVMLKSQTIAKIKKKLNLSERATEKLCHILREDEVKVEKNTRRFLKDVDHLLMPYFENRRMEMEVKVNYRVLKMVRKRGGTLKKQMVEAKKIVKKLKNIAIVKNLRVFLQKICEWRNISPADAWYRVCQDGGGGSFKSVVSVMDKGIDPSKEDKGEMLSGVNRLLPLAVCPGVPERHFNLRQISEHLQFHLIPNLRVVVDFCLLNAMVGISSHGGKYSCSYCEGASTINPGRPRTFGSLKKRYAEYQKAGSNPAKMQQFANVIQPSLTIAAANKLVMDVHPMPELHCLIGVVNHLVKLMIEVDSSTLDLLQKQNIFRHGYQGGGLDGNNSFK